MKRSFRTSMYERRALAKNVQGLRKSCGLSIQQLASFLGWTVQDVEAVERGDVGLSAGRQVDLMRWVNGARPKRS